MLFKSPIVTISIYPLILIKVLAVGIMLFAWEQYRSYAHEKKLIDTQDRVQKGVINIASAVIAIDRRFHKMHLAETLQDKYPLIQAVQEDTKKIIALTDSLQDQLLCPKETVLFRGLLSQRDWLVVQIEKSAKATIAEHPLSSENNYLFTDSFDHFLKALYKLQGAVAKRSEIDGQLICVGEEVR